MRITRIRHRIAQINVRKALAALWLALGRPGPRDAAILVGLVLVWSGLRDIYQPAAPVAIGCFLLWFTTIRKAPS